jgi:hypothetical protein
MPMGSKSTKLTTSLFSTLVLLSVFFQPVNSAQVLTGSVTEERVQKLTTDMTWYTSLQAAEQSAHSQNKLIFWVHMLGNLDGKT